MKKRIRGFSELIKQNKEELLRDKKQLEFIERKIDEKHAQKEKKADSLN